MKVKRRKVTREISREYKNAPLVQRGIEYAEDIVAGAIPAGQYTVLAMARQLKDLKRKRFAYTFDAAEAERVATILQLFPHVKGPLQGKPLKSEPWQLFIDTTVFGWINKKTGFRRFHEVYEFVPRKNGKSVRGAAKGLYMLTLDGEGGPEVFAGNVTEKEAWKIFGPAKAMAKKADEFRDTCGVEVLANTIVTPTDNGKFEALIGSPADGDNPSCALIDEFHQHSSDELYETMKTGMGSRGNWLIWIFTTAGNTFGGPCYQYQQDMMKVLSGAVKDDEKFAIMYHADETDDWKDPITLRKANPNIGVSVSEGFLLARQREAITTTRRQNAFKTKHLNMWVSARSAFFNMAKWSRCRNTQLKIEDFHGRSCLFVVDLASKSDMAAYIKIFPEVRANGIHYTAFGEYYLPEAMVAEDPTGNYKAWDSENLLNVHDDDEIDFSLIKADIKRDLLLFSCDEFVYDPWRATQLAQEIKKLSVETVEYHNTVKNMSEAMKELEAAVNSKRFHYDGDPILTWMAGNVTAREDANHNVFPRKSGERNINKIDGIVAGIMGVGRLMHRDDIGSLDDFLENMIS